MIPLGLYYIRWHYSYALADLIGIVRNFLWFFYEFFSIPLLIKTLFVPFHRIEENTRTGLHLATWAESTLINMLMRIIGAFLRLLLIAFGIVFMLITLISGFVFMVAWLLAPFVLIVMVVSGVTLITTA